MICSALVSMEVGYSHEYVAKFCERASNCE